MREAGMEVELFEGVEPDPSVETVLRGAEACAEFSRTGLSPSAAARPSMRPRPCGRFYEYPDVTFESLCIPFNFRSCAQKRVFCAIPSTSGTATE
jgi:alcohol dehydrogenase class IV